MLRNATDGAGWFFFCHRRAVVLVLATVALWSTASRANAAEPRRLTFDGIAKQDCRVLANGESVVYSVYEKPTQISLMQLRLADGTVVRLHPDAGTSEFEPTISADGRYIAFVQSRGNLSLKLVIRDRQQQTDAVFDPGGGFAGLHSPHFAPDLRSVIFSLPAKGGQQLVTCNLQGQERRELTATPGISNWPMYSPDGRQVVFGSSRDGDFEIYVMQADGSNVRRLTDSPGRDIRPRWSPDGKRIAFVSVRDGNPEIYVMQADGTRVVRVTDHPERDDYPCWHPDGRRLIFVAERDGRSDVYELAVSE